LSGPALVSGSAEDRSAARDDKLRAIPGAKSA